MGQNSAPDLSCASLAKRENISVYSASMRLQPSGDAPSSDAVISAVEIQGLEYRAMVGTLRTIRSSYMTRGCYEV